MEFGLLLLRLVVGLTIAAHGAQKLFGWFGGYGIAGTGGFFEKLGLRPGKTYATIAGIGEFGGGLLLALGLLTPLGSMLVMAVMFTAMATVHLPKGFFETNGGIEFPLVIVAATLTLAFTGAGSISLDAAFRIQSGGWEQGLGALILALVACAGMLATRTREKTVRVS
jgi:putative oxidoreductase